jgi:hypothetical protein
VNTVASAELVEPYTDFMRKLVFLLVIAVLATFGIGRFNLGEAGAMRFLTKMETLMGAGKSDEVCAMFHDDLEVDIADHSGETTRFTSGGRNELCAITVEVVAGLRLVPHSMKVDYTGVTARQTLGKPWTGEIRYSEHRTFGVPGANISLRTVSEDEITLVQTFSGVKLRKLKSAVFRAETT